MSVRETRDQCVASMYIGVNVELHQVDAALEDELLFAQAFEAAGEAVKSVLAEAGRDYLVEVDL